MTRLALVLSLLLAPAALAQDTYTGMLTTDDLRGERGAYQDSFPIEIDQPRSLSVRMFSGAFDTYLILESPSGVTTENDDNPDTSTSQIDVFASETGTWTAYATAYSDAGTGDYEVTITQGEPGTLELVEGRLDPRDEQALKGERYDTHTVEVGSGEQVTFEVSSYGFDGYLVVDTPGEQRLRNDDAGSTALSRIGPVSGEAGTYTIYVTSLSPDEYGAYDLRIIRTAK